MTAKKESKTKVSKRLTKGPLPDAASIVEIYRTGKQLAKTATANAWGVLGGSAGYVSSTLLMQAGKSLPVSRWEVFAIAYTAAIAIYTLFSRSSYSTRRCLGFAELMFAEGQVSASEYRQVRANCLRRSGLIGRE
jgi:hypothetical protein